MFPDILLLALSLALILGASVLFTNAVEMLGERLGMHQGATGSILAAVGTALPETVIPIIAILWFRDAAAQNVAVGAIAGAPFMLGTLAFFVTGAAVFIFARLRRRTVTMKVDMNVFSRDMTFFLACYGLAVGATFFHEQFQIKAAVAVILLAAYVYYTYVTIKGKAAELEDVEELYLCRLFKMQPGMLWVVIQILVSLGIMVFGAHLFVGCTKEVAEMAGISPLVLSLIITPVATELPEKCNSVLWIGRKKDALAIGNITGAMVFQSCFPVAFGLVGTHWDLIHENHGVTMYSAVVTLACGALILAVAKFAKGKVGKILPWLLLSGGFFYALFIVHLLRQKM